MAQINETPPELPVTIAEPVRNLVYSCIAKKPADRPASAAHLARAAQSLRRGDVAAAASAVPGVIGAGSLAATAGANYGKDDATRVLETAAVASETRKRNPWTWPLIALIAILAVVLVSTIIALVANPERERPPASSSTPTSATPTPSKTTETAALSEDELLGKSRAQVQDILTGKGLKLDAHDGVAAQSIEDQGTAYSVDPTGPRLPIGTTIAVTFYTDVPTPPSPGALTRTPPPYTASMDVDISWATYSACPSGFALTGYQFTVTDGVASLTSPVSASENSMVITLRDTPGDTTVSYIAICGAKQSQPSATQTFTVPAP
jgi:serine/threonine-protein kinase